MRQKRATLTRRENTSYENKGLNKYFELKTRLELLAVFSRKSGHGMSQQCNHIKYKHIQFHSGMRTQKQTDCACIFLSLNPSSYKVVPNILASHAHAILPIATL